MKRQRTTGFMVIVSSTDQLIVAHVAALTSVRCLSFVCGAANVVICECTASIATTTFTCRPCAKRQHGPIIASDIKRVQRANRGGGKKILRAYCRSAQSITTSKTYRMQHYNVQYDTSNLSGLPVPTERSTLDVYDNYMLVYVARVPSIDPAHRSGRTSDIHTHTHIHTKGRRQLNFTILIALQYLVCEGELELAHVCVRCLDRKRYVKCSE